MSDLRRAIANAVRLLEREAVLRRASIEGGAKEFEDDAAALREAAKSLGGELRFEVGYGSVEVQVRDELVCQECGCGVGEHMATGRCP